jgi:hypothetical protein
MGKLSIVILVAFCWACKGKKSDAAATEPPKPAGNHIPFKFMIEEDLRLIDSSPVSIDRYITVDSGNPAMTFIQPAEIRQLATRFMEPDFTDSLVKADYTESSYADETTNSVTFYYEATQPARPVKKVYLNFTRTPAGDSKLKWINLYRESGDTVQRLYWKKGSYCMMNETYKTNGTPAEKTTKVFWDGSDLKAGNEMSEPEPEMKAAPSAGRK